MSILINNTHRKLYTQDQDHILTIFEGLINVLFLYLKIEIIEQGSKQKTYNAKIYSIKCFDQPIDII